MKPFIKFRMRWDIEMAIDDDDLFAIAPLYRPFHLSRWLIESGMSWWPIVARRMQ